MVGELGGYSRVWDGLVDQMRLPTPFLRSWWLANVAEGEPRFVLVLDDDDELVGGLALQRSTRSGIEWLQFCGSGPLEPDHLDLVAAMGSECDVARLIGEWLGRPGSRVIDLVGLVRGGRLEGVVPGWGTMTEIEVAPYARLPSTVESYMTTRPARMRNTVTRTNKRLTAKGVRFELVRPDDFDAALESLRLLHDTRWGDESGFLSKWDAFSAAMRAGVAAGDVRFHRLVAPDEQVVAIEVEFVVANRMSFYQAGRLTDRDWRGAGSVLRFHVISSAIDEGMTEFDLLRGGENYKLEWSNGQRPLDRVRNGIGPGGVALVGVARLNLRIRRAAVVLNRQIRPSAPSGTEVPVTRPSGETGAAKKIRVVFYTDASQIGGAESVAKNLLRELDEQFAVTIAGTNERVVRDIASVRPSAAPLLLPAIRDRTDLAAMRAHRAQFALLRPDLFHFNLSEGSSCQYAILAALSIRGSKLVVTENSPMGVRSELSRRIKRRSARRFGAHIAVGDAAAALIEADIGLPSGSLRVIPNAVPVIEHRPPTRDDPRPTVGAVSRFDPVKGLDVLVRAMALVEGARLVIVGDGEQRGEIEELVRELGLGDRVELTGWVDGSRHLLPNFDVFVLPSRLEGMPMSVIEAMHAGVAVIATDVGSVREVVSDGVSGLVVPPDDADALAKAISRLLDDEPMRSHFAAEGQRIALDRFTSGRNVRAYEAVYREILDRPTS